MLGVLVLGVLVLVVLVVGVVLVVLVLLAAGLMPSARSRWRMRRRMRWPMGGRMRRRGAHSAARWHPSRLAPLPDDRLAESLR